MSATSPSPNSPPNSSSATPPPQSPPTSSSPPAPLTSSPTSSQPNANPPETSNSTVNSPPPQSFPPPPPPTAPSPPPPQPPVPSPPPLPSSNAPTPNQQSPPPASPPPQPPPQPPPASSAPAPSTSASSPPADTPPPPPPPSPSSTPPTTPPLPPSSNPPPATSPPPPLAKPPENSPPPPSSRAPERPPSPPAATPPRSSPPPPPPRSVSPRSSPPPPPASISPEKSPPPPTSTPPRSAPPPPRRTPPTPSGSNPTPSPVDSPPMSSPTPSIIRLSPPRSSPVSPSPPSWVSISPSDNGTSNNSGPNVPGSTNSNGNAGIGTGGVVAIAVVASIIVLSLITLVFWCVRKQRKKYSGLSGHVMPSPMVSSPKSDSAFLKAHSSAPLIGSGSGSDVVNSPTSQAGLGNSRAWFTFEELVQATNGFSAENFLGEGGFGSVYKGSLPDGREIAVKQLKIGGGQGEREFKAEVEIISRIHHRHLVSLVGYCISDSRRLLVYDYVPNNNLYYHLHGEGRPVLDWVIRVKVAAGAARGIAYLHEDCHPRIIHRDIKSSNILLDNNFEARVSDFGLAKLALDADTHITTRVMGTFGYMAPEYASSGKLTDKSDVYSFGVVLLELITGRKPVDASQPLGDESLVEWARPLLSQAIESGEYNSLVDPNLERNYVETEMFRMIEIAAACVRHSSTKRPRMGQVVRAFDSFGMSDLTNGMKVGESEVFTSAQQSEEIRWFRRMAFGSQDYSTDFFSQDSLNNSRETRENNV